MKKLFAGFVLALLATTMVFAQNGTPSSKATAAINTAVGCTYSSYTTLTGILTPANCQDIFTGAAVTVTPDSFAQIMTTTVKVSNSQSLFVSPSLVTGLYTNTKTKTSTGSTSTAIAAGGVYMRAVLYDGNGNLVAVGYPAAVCTDEILGCYTSTSGALGVVLDSRVQTLSQTLSNCVTNTLGIAGTCSFDSTIQLIQQTTSAHTFNFIFPNVGVGTYTMAIEAAVNSSASVSGSGSAIGAAAYGLGSVTVESVRMVHDFSF